MPEWRMAFGESARRTSRRGASVIFRGWVVSRCAMRAWCAGHCRWLRLRPICGTPVARLPMFRAVRRMSGSSATIRRRRCSAFRLPSSSGLCSNSAGSRPPRVRQARVAGGALRARLRRAPERLARPCRVQPPVPRIGSLGRRNRRRIVTAAAGSALVSLVRRLRVRVRMAGAAMARRGQIAGSRAVRATARTRRRQPITAAPAVRKPFG